MVRGISIGPGEVAGYLGRLRDGFEALGVPCEHFLYVPAHKFNYAVSDHFLKGVSDFWMGQRARGGIRAWIAQIADKVIRLLALIYAISRYDVFIFSGYGSFFRFLELPLLKLLGKRTIVIFLGSDARPPYLSGKHLDDHAGAFDPRKIAAESRAIRKQMAWVERYASVIVNHTGTAQFSTRSFIRFSALGMPMSMSSPEAAASSGAPRSEGPLRVLHAPSRPIAKGTHEVRAAIAQLQGEGIEVELIELTGVPNAEVLRQLARCDIVVDELYSDLPLATFGAEAASFGKPAIVGSLYVERFLIDNPEASTPTIFVHPAELEPTLRRLVSDAEWRAAEGARGRAFLASNCAPRDVAARYLRLAQGEVPAGWIVDPEGLDYIGGWGLSETAWREQIGGYLNALGEDGLQLGERSRLKRAILSALQGDRVS